MRTSPSSRHDTDALSGDDGGFVIVWMALMLLVLLAFCGFGIDVSNWWYVGQKEQRAADAAALAGSVFLPNDLPSAQATALKIAGQNGYRNGVNATVVATQEPQPSRIRVTITSTVTNFFAGLVGFNTETISRDAVADFQGPVPMGSPTNKLGQDPDTCDPATAGSCANFWLNTSGPKGTKREGDRFATGVCNTGSEAGCLGSTTNPEYAPDGYLFRIRVTSIQAGQPLVLQVYDPAWMYTEDFCNNANMPSNLQQNGIPGLTGAPWNITFVNPGGPISRYGTSNAGQSINVGGSRWCTGDQNAGGAGGNINNTTYIVRKPDSTPWTDIDNDIASCPAAYFRGINQPMQTLLDPANGSSDAMYVKNYFHRWATVCVIPSTDVELGDYIIQVKTNADTGGLSGPGPTMQTWPAGDETAFNSVSNNNAGYNRYAFRRGMGSGADPERWRPHAEPRSERFGCVDLGDPRPSDLRERRRRHDPHVLSRPDHAHGGFGPHAHAELLRHRRRRQRLGQCADPGAPGFEPGRRRGQAVPHLHVSPRQRRRGADGLELHDPEHDDWHVQRAARHDDDPDPVELRLQLRERDRVLGQGRHDLQLRRSAERHDHLVGDAQRRPRSTRRVAQSGTAALCCKQRLRRVVTHPLR